ncbi:FIVAR domain-containing protein [Lacticaseibacillus casei]|uniref:FIVAR domain-containing protein n=1 Tax=Lacticaseibacillus casei TaxID=1582 RepID=UPI001CDB48BE|nr:FIVAR domain-containing protein [Lacticaseibacillus casei]
MLADNKAVQTDVDAALQKLNDAYDGLTVNPDTKPDKSALQAAVDAAQALSDAAVTGEHEGNYPADAVTTLKGAITAAKRVLTDASASKNDVTNAVSTLNQAVATFKKAAITVNRDPLTQLVKATQALKEADYTSDSWTTFQQAITAAQKLLAGKPSQQELDAAVTALQAAKNNLVAAGGQLPSTGGSDSSSASQAPSSSSSSATSSSTATDQTNPASESSSSSNKNKYPNTGESQLSLAVTLAALALLAGIGGLAWFLHEKGKAKQE